MLLTGCATMFAHVEPLQGQTSSQVYRDVAACEAAERDPDQNVAQAVTGLLFGPWGGGLAAPKYHGPVYRQCMASRGYRPLTPEDYR